MEKRNQNKESLLQSKMCELPLGKAFTDCFYRSEKNGSPAPSLSQFIKLNNFLKTDSDIFLSFENPEKHYSKFLFRRRSKKWEMLKNFLLENGFTCEDWPMLLPLVKGPGGRMEYDFSKLSKEKLIDMPINAICPGKSTSGADYSTKVSDILKFDLYFHRHYEGAFVIQRKLKSLGFSEEDGEFMKINKPKMKTKNYFITKLVEERGFTQEEAVNAVEIGLRAGWIQVD